MHSEKITGVVLAGGRGLRMGACDKGLLPFKGKPLVYYALRALEQITRTILINANRHTQEYQTFGYPVISDANDCFEGPLAGLLSAMKSAQTPYVLTVPCDSPLMDGRLLNRLVDRLIAEKADICVAHDGERLHPVFMIVKRELMASLEAYLAQGDRKVGLWLKQQACVQADYSDHPELFANINTQEELAQLEGTF